MYGHLRQKDKAALLPTLTSVDTEATQKMNRKPVERSGEKAGGRVEINADLCKGCLLCIEACPPRILLMSENLNKMGYHPVYYAGSGCTGCGVCFYVCPEPGTIRVYKRVKAN
jgi:NAD-dependent dihydropyrimidine dehydrogenase PreA subunit